MRSLCYMLVNNDDDAMRSTRSLNASLFFWCTAADVVVVLEKMCMQI